MSRVIDIEQVSSRRAALPQISFRRNDNDRRPARVVIRPQDGPGILREKLAEERRHQLTLKTPSRPGTVYQIGGERTAEFRAHMVTCVRVVLGGAEILPDVGAHFDVGLERVRDFLSEACKLGLLTKTMGTRNKRQYGIYSATPAGEAFMAEAGQ